MDNITNLFDKDENKLIKIFNTHYEDYISETKKLTPENRSDCFVKAYEDIVVLLKGTTEYDYKQLEEFKISLSDKIYSLDSETMMRVVDKMMENVEPDDQLFGNPNSKLTAKATEEAIYFLDEHEALNDDVIKEIKSVCSKIISCMEEMCLLVLTEYDGSFLPLQAFISNDNYKDLQEVFNNVMIALGVLYINGGKLYRIRESDIVNSVDGISYEDNKARVLSPYEMEEFLKPKSRVPYPGIDNGKETVFLEFVL